MRICLIGSGYVGLVSGACLASLGNTVTIIDKDKNKISSLKKGKIPFYEPNLQELVQQEILSQRLSFKSSYQRIEKNDIFFLCVDTPSDLNGSANLNNLMLAFNKVINQVLSDAIIVIKSTVPMGTTSLLQSKANQFIKAHKKSFKIYLCSNPEFLKEGAAINDFLRPDRIIIGASHSYPKEVLSKLYKPLNRKNNKLITMSAESAELSKYGSNAFLATKISFINEIAKLCDLSRANIHDVRRGIGSDKRIGEEFLYAGLGFGGSCFPKDLSALNKILIDSGTHISLIRRVQEINDLQIDYFFKKIKGFLLKKYQSINSKPSILIWGLSFKPGTDDIRESLAIKLIKRFLKENYKVNAYDPQAVGNSKLLFKSQRNLVFLKDKYQNISSNDILIICTEWKEFWEPDLNKISKLKLKTIFDGRNILNKKNLKKEKISYYGIGS